MDIVITLIVFSAAVIIGAFSFVIYKVTHPAPPPEISAYEKSRKQYLETGDIEALLQMEEEMEKEDS